MSEVYQKNIEQQKLIVQKLKKISNLYSLLRLLVVVAFATSIYQMLMFKSEQNAWPILMAVSIIIFVGLLVIYQKNAKRLAYHQQLLQLNVDEFSFLNNNKLSFDSGKEFVDSEDAHSFDLDLFGEKSLFQHINRTHLFLGKQKLANFFTQTPNADEVIKRQEAVKELAVNLELRQHLSVLSALSEDKKEYHDSLVNWTKNKSSKTNRILFGLSFLLPILFVVVVGLYLIDANLVNNNWIGYLFFANMLAVGFNFKNISKEIQNSSKIAQTLSTYAQLIKVVKNQQFESDWLIKQQQKLVHQNHEAAASINQLARLFEQLDTVANLMISVMLNGLFQFHNHVFFRVNKWKTAHGNEIFEWMDTIAEVEALVSIANFAYNNPDYIYPTVNKNNDFSFEKLGHPLIDKNKRVCNDINFLSQKITILTGSNMSGKSTFLRTIGVNLLLAQTGAPICTTKATFSPIQLWVSMRLTDSLNEGESYFYAEVKRLKQIVLEAQKQPIFVLLDEILRGTNSDDKTQGTIGVVKKMMDCNAIGLIATHDLEVCTIEKIYPEKLNNKSFEGLIKNNDLYFDYTLRDGICQNKNATFIMQKMEII